MTRLHVGVTVVGIIAAIAHSPATRHGGAAGGPPRAVGKHSRSVADSQSAPTQSHWAQPTAQSVLPHI